MLLLGFNESQTSCESKFRYSRSISIFDISSLLRVFETNNRLVDSRCRRSGGWRNQRNLYQPIPHCPASVIQGTNLFSVFNDVLIHCSQTRTTAVLLIITFFHAVSFFAAAFYLPVYFQVLGASATRAGVEYVINDHEHCNNLLSEISILGTGCCHSLLEQQPCLLFLVWRSPKPEYIDL